MSEKLISIIMPAYNANKTIQESIESILKQTYTNWELIIIDDSSKDNTLNIIEEYRKNDHRIKIIKNEENLGVAETRNKGLNKAQGDYIAFLDADDMWINTKLEKQLTFMLNNNLTFTFTDIIVLNGGKEKEIHFDKVIDFNKLLKSNQISCLTVMLESSLILESRMKSIGHEDYLFWLEIIKKNDIKAYNVNEVLGYYREASGSLSSNKIKAAKWQWNIYRNELNLPFLQSVINFTFYAINGIAKRL